MYSARFSKDGDVIATTFGSGASQVILFNTYSNIFIFWSQFLYWYSNILFFKFIYFEVQVRNGQTGELRVTVRSSLETSFPVMCCRFNPIHPEIFYASSACGSIFMCKTTTHEFTCFIEGILINNLITVFLIILPWKFKILMFRSEMLKKYMGRPWVFDRRGGGLKNIIYLLFIHILIIICSFLRNSKKYIK